MCDPLNLYSALVFQAIEGVLKLSVLGLEPRLISLFSADELSQTSYLLPEGVHFVLFGALDAAFVLQNVLNLSVSIGQLLF